MLVFRIKPIARLIFKAQNFWKPYDFVPLPTIKYYRTLMLSGVETHTYASAQNDFKSQTRLGRRPARPWFNNS